MNDVRYNMQIKKDDIQKAVLMAAEKIFCKKGFAKTSMREIAAASQVGLGNLYNYYRSKDEIFCTILQPVLNDFADKLDKSHGEHSRDITTFVESEYFEESLQQYCSILNKNRRLLDLLFFKAQGSSLSNFKKDYTDYSTDLVKKHMGKMKLIHPNLNTSISDFSLHMHTVWMFTIFEEIVMHDIKGEEMTQVLSEYLHFEISGWRELMKL